MRQFSIIFLLIFMFTVVFAPKTFSAIKGAVEYSIPIDYTKLSKNELEEKASVYFYNAMRLKDEKIDNDLTNALFLYNVLQKVDTQNIDYIIKSGILYDKLNKDRYAKGDFARAIGLDSSKPEAYFYYGEFYYKRELYRRALKYYNEAYKKGYNTNYDLLYKISDVYEKLGDTRSALKYLYEAKSQSPNSELEDKIRQLETLDSINKEYYSDTRIRG